MFCGSAVRCLIQAIETGNIIILKLCHYGVVSHEPLHVAFTIYRVVLKGEESEIVIEGLTSHF
jgi:hypothetical protein